MVRREVLAVSFTWDAQASLPGASGIPGMCSGTLCAQVQRPCCLAGRAAAELAEAADSAQRCVDASPGLRAGWKLLGDALLGLGRVAAGTPRAGEDISGAGAAAVQDPVWRAVAAVPEALRPGFQAQAHALRTLREARRAYARLAALEGGAAQSEGGGARPDSDAAHPSTDVAIATLAEALAVEELARAVAPRDAEPLRALASSLLGEARERVREALGRTPDSPRLWAMFAATCRKVRAEERGLTGDASTFQPEAPRTLPCLWVLES